MGEFLYLGMPAFVPARGRSGRPKLDGKTPMGFDGTPNGLRLAPFVGLALWKSRNSTNLARAGARPHAHRCRDILSAGTRELTKLTAFLWFVIRSISDVLI